MKGKIALEEHFAIQDTLEDSNGFLPDAVWTELSARLLDIHGKRLKQMDEHGIEMMLLSLNAPAIQAIPDVKKANELARKANDFLAEEVAKRPDRFQALAALPMQDPDMATRELQRCVKDLGFVGSLVNGFSQAGDPNVPIYYDLKQYWPFWAEHEKLDVPFYLHPRNPLPQDFTDLCRTSLADGPDLGVRTGDRRARVAADGVGTVRRASQSEDRAWPYGRRTALQHVADRQSQRLDQGAAELSGKEESWLNISRPISGSPRRAISVPRR